MMLLAGMTIAFAYFRKIPTEGTSGAQVLALVVPRLVVISVLSSLTIFAGKIFGAARHNYVVNQHKMRALNSFDAILDAANADTKQVILQHVASAIFSHQPSGFSARDVDSGQLNTVELVRNVTRTGE